VVNWERMLFAGLDLAFMCSSFLLLSFGKVTETAVVFGLCRNGGLNGEALPALTPLQKRPRRLVRRKHQFNLQIRQCNIFGTAKLRDH
jgi:hypothetical protein